MEKTILQWKSKVQYKRNTPYISLIKHLSGQYFMMQGSEVVCRLIAVDNKLRVIIELE